MAKKKPEKVSAESRIHQRRAPHGIEQDSGKVNSWANISGDTKGQREGGGFSATIPLLADRAISWSLTEGVQPFRQRFAFRPEDVPAMKRLAKTGPVTLTIFSNNQTVKATNLWIVELPGSPTPQVAVVTLADRRCWWNYGHLKRLYNVMKPTGVKRLDSLDKVPKILEQRVNKFAFKPGSLKPKVLGGIPTINDSPWKAKDIIEDVLTHPKEGVLFNESKRTGGSVAEVDLSALDEIGGGRAHNLTIMPIYDFEIDASSEVALAKALQQIPGAGITVDLDGTIRVFRRFEDLHVDKNDVRVQKHGATLDMLGPEIKNEGHHEFVENKYLRPKHIEVFFTCEAELRFDFGELTSYKDRTVGNDRATTVGRTAVADQLGESMLIENVLPVPDYELLGVTERGCAAFTAVQGTWISFDAALDAWNDFDKNGALYLGPKGEAPLNKAGIKLDHDFIQRALPGYVDLWTGLMAIGRAVKGANWPARIAMIKKHYRQTWRINSLWMDKIESMRARRVAILDFGSGTRAPSPVWTDHSAKSTQRSFWLHREHSNLYVNFKGGLDVDQPINKDVELTPANLVILDHDQGIVSTEFVGHVNGVYDVYTPGLMEPNVRGNYAVADSKGNPPIFANAANEDQNAAMGVPRMAKNGRTTFIISAVPATPNSNNQLKMLEVHPHHIKARKLLPEDMLRGMDEALGPPLQLRVGAGVEVARIAWNDDKKREFEKLFGTFGGNFPDLDNLIINLGKENKKSEGGASMWDIAMGLAATTYAAYADSWQGNAAGHINPKIQMGGFTESVKFELRPDGTGLTVLNVSAKTPTMPFTMFLGQSTRNILSRLPQVL